MKKHRFERPGQSSAVDSGNVTARRWFLSMLRTRTAVRKVASKPSSGARKQCGCAGSGDAADDLFSCAWTMVLSDSENSHGAFQGHNCVGWTACECSNAYVLFTCWSSSSLPPVVLTRRVCSTTTTKTDYCGTYNGPDVFEWSWQQGESQGERWLWRYAGLA